MTSQTISSNDPMCIMASISVAAKWNETASRKKAYRAAGNQSDPAPFPGIWENRSAGGEDASRLVDGVPPRTVSQDADIRNPLGSVSSGLVQDDEVGLLACSSEPISLSRWQA